jgi:CubicO group peptidase (beta-lactamase class C family)
MHRAIRLCVALLITPAAVAAQSVPSWPALSSPFYALTPGVPRIPEIDSQRLRAAVDSFMGRDMADLRVPGAVVAIVQNGNVILLRGYGVADSARGTPVDPDHTVFRLGSVTKPFTAIAALQLVEQGRLDLHADVNRYLRAFQVPEAFGRPVTAHDLLTHTAGFDTRLNGTAAGAENRVRSLAEYLASDLPPRVRPP